MELGFRYLTCQVIIEARWWLSLKNGRLVLLSNLVLSDSLPFLKEEEQMFELQNHLPAEGT